MKASELLTRARARIALPEAWTKRWFARDAGGNKINETDPDAVCFCAIGAVSAECTEITGSRRIRQVEDACTYLRREAPSQVGVSHYNDRDTTTHADVLAWFDRAIAAAKKAELGSAAPAAQ